MERKVYSKTDLSDGSCSTDSVLYDWLYDQWSDSIKIYIRVPTYKRWGSMGEKHTYAVRLLGICIDEYSSGIPLECHYRYGEKTDGELSVVDDNCITRSGMSDCNIWSSGIC